MSEKIPYKIYLSESEMPKYWYNLRADMVNKPAPMLNPGTLQPMTKEELSAVFCEDLVDQELNVNDALIPKKSAISTKCTVPRPWYVHIVLKNILAHPPKSTINSKATTPRAATS